MSKKPIPHPYNIERKSALVRAITPSSVGTLTAAAFAFYPKLADGFQVPEALLNFPLTSVLNRIPTKAYAALVGFLLGYTTTHSANWLRWRLIRSLFSYQGWVSAPRSTRTKIWALLLKLLRGPGPYSTFEFQAVMPKQPLPDLNTSLDKWLEVNRQLLTQEEFELTKEAVEEFRANEGPQLQAYLQQKANKEDSYISDYWINLAYLASRVPLPVNSNYYLVNGVDTDLTTDDQLTRAAVTVHLHLRTHDMIEDGTFKAVTMDVVPLCMLGYRHLFKTVRIPGENIDSLQRFSSSRHIIVVRKGHYFKVDMYLPSQRNRSKFQLISAQEIRQQLEKIVTLADELPDEPPVAALTSQKRNVWAKQREVLMKKNGPTLHDVESALFILILDDKDPTDRSDHAHLALTGGGSRCLSWFDKCFNMIYSANPSWLCINIEHTVIDGMVFATMAEMFLVFEKTYYDNGKLKKDSKPVRNLQSPARLEWNVEDLENEISIAHEEFMQTSAAVDVYVGNPSYGKGQIKKCGVSPNGFIQMALQLAYYRLHKEIPKTYEPSTSRLFVLGRTETVHPVSAHSVAFVKAMDDPSSRNPSKIELLKKAVKYEGEFRLEATVGNGCDRHMLALFCASRELGMDVPKIYMDKSWQGSFKLSTSQTPNKLWEYGPELYYPRCSAGFGPSCQDGYGVSYIIYGEDLINLHVSSWKTCPETDSRVFTEGVIKAFEDMKEMFAK